jgi:hypothetical protein
MCCYQECAVSVPEINCFHIAIVVADMYETIANCKRFLRTCRPEAEGFYHDALGLEVVHTSDPHVCLTVDGFGCLVVLLESSVALAPDPVRARTVGSLVPDLC